MTEKKTAEPVKVSAKGLPMVPIDSLKPYENNAKIHGPEQIEQLRRSLREFGFVSPVLIDEEGNLIAGHGRVEAARAEGMKEVPCVLVSNLTEEQRRAYILADNRLTEAGEWDAARVKIEMEELAAAQFDVTLTGFTMDEIESFGTEPQGKNEAGHFWGENEGESNEEYEAFTDKFKTKLTTDDCYTPENIYTAVRDWAVEHYGLTGAEIVRPFYPGGDYENESYPEGCAVIDNPPFSILSKICRFYTEHGIRFFLFAPSLTLFSTAAGECNYLPVGAGITYENGAVVSTSFVTNLGAWKIETAPDLRRIIDDLDDENRHEKSTELPGYTYPDCVMTSQRIVPVARYEKLQIPAAEARFVRSLDSQKKQGKAIFGGGFLLSEKAAAEKTAAEKAAAEKAARHVWTLSDREKEIVRELTAAEKGT
jgi:hypothetical protein